MSADNFKYLYRSGEKYLIVVDVSQRVSLNGVYSHQANFENRIVVHVEKVQGGAGFLGVNYRVVERSERENSVRNIAKQSTAKFWRDSQGGSSVPSDSFVPLVRGVPSFPQERPLKGDTWSAPAQEVFDLRGHYGITAPYPIDILVNYTYLGKKVSTIDGKSYPALAISYAIDHRRRFSDPESGRNVGVTIKGLSRQEMLWDEDNGRPHSYHDRYRLDFGLLDGRELRIVGEARGRSTPIDPAQILETERVIKEQLRDLNLETAEVASTPEGVRINLEHILFRPDRSELLDGEEKKIAAIAAVLKDHNERDKLVVGHTARVGDSKNRQILSKKRAETVALLLQKAGIKRLIIQGVGSSEPVGDNDTPEGRRKNRRVEIIILE